MSRLDAFGLAKQSALGTKNSTVDYWTPVETSEPGWNPEFYSAEETVGHRFPTDEELGGAFWEIPQAGAARAASFPRMLSGFFGAPTTTTPDGAGAPTARNHAFDPALAAGLVPHSLFVHRADPSPKVSDLYWDALGNSLTLSVEPNNFLRYEAGWLARDYDDTVSIAPSITSDLTRRWTFDEVKCYLSVDGGGETEEKVSAYSLTYNNNITTDDWVLGSKRLYALPIGNATAEISVTPVGNLSQHYRRVLADPRNNVKIRLEALGSIIGAATRYKVEVIMYRARYREGALPIGAGETTRNMPLTFSTSYDPTASKFVVVNVVNVVATY